MSENAVKSSDIRIEILGAILTIVGTILSGPLSLLLVSLIKIQPEWVSSSVFVDNYHRCSFNVKFHIARLGHRDVGVWVYGLRNIAGRGVLFWSGGRKNQVCVHTEWNPQCDRYALDSV